MHLFEETGTLSDAPTDLTITPICDSSLASHLKDGNIFIYSFGPSLEETSK
jgi:hypothetical protein